MNGLSRLVWSIVCVKIKILRRRDIALKWPSAVHLRVGPTLKCNLPLYHAYI